MRVAALPDDVVRTTDASTIGQAGVARGFFITFEGGEGAGKSTQISRLAERLRAMGHDVLVTREPGGSPGAEAVRHVLLSGAAEPFGPVMEAILFAAARSDHVEQVIRPAVERGAVVLCDRFMDSSRVYQGITGDLDPKFMAALERITVNGMVPDLTLILDRASNAPRRGAEKERQTASRRRPSMFIVDDGKPISRSRTPSRTAASSSMPDVRPTRSQGSSKMS